METIERIPGKRLTGRTQQRKSANAQNPQINVDAGRFKHQCTAWLGMVLLVLCGAQAIGCSTPLSFSENLISSQHNSGISFASDEGDHQAPTTANEFDIDHTPVDGPPISTSEADSSSFQPTVRLASFAARSNQDTTGAEIPRLDIDTPDRQENKTGAPSIDPGTAKPDESLAETDPSRAQEQTTSLTLQNVLESVEVCYPEIIMAIAEIDAAAGDVLEAQGGFDRTLRAHTMAQPLGFYQTYRNGLSLNQPLFGGGEVYGSYRIGDGNFEPWYGERETNEGGEFKAGVKIPLLKDRSIDRRRSQLFAARFQVDQANANLAARQLEIKRAATQAYWNWVVTGYSVQIQRRLLKLAEARVEIIRLRVEKEDLAKIAEIDNDRFIAKRKSELIKSERAFQSAAIKLSLFLRNDECSPVVPTAMQLPKQLPKLVRIGAQQFQDDLNNALMRNPNIIQLKAKRRREIVKLRYAENLTLPKVDLQGVAGQDIGARASSTGDKSPFELQLGLIAEVPIERRAALGKIRSTQAKIAQIDAKIDLIGDKIQTDLNDAAFSVNAACDQMIQSQKNVELAKRSLELGQLAFEKDDIDLITTNIYETAVSDAELLLLETQFNYFIYKAMYESILVPEGF